jgi:hypothetical protein
MIRTRTIWIARKQHMQRIEPDRDGACSRSLFGKEEWRDVQRTLALPPSKRDAARAVRLAA